MFEIRGVNTILIMAKLTPFMPPRLPPDSLDRESLLPLVGPAHRALGRFDALLKNLPNPRLLIAPLTTSEAVASSRIEGTQASLEDVMQFQAEQKEAENSPSDDLREVMNYHRAMDFASRALRQGGMTLSEPLIKKAHSILLTGTRGAQKSPGQFRDRQVHISVLGRPVEEASYVPPQATHVPALVEALLRYADNQEPDTLIQMAIVHAQFELIHPFRDGNGRVGRLIMPLFLHAKRVIDQPCFYISEYLEKHREQYFACLQAISAENNWNRWTAFFLRSVTEQSLTNAEKSQDIVELREDTLNLAQELTRSRYAPQLADYLCTQPVFTTASFRRAAKVPASSVGRLLKRIEGAGLVEKTVRGRGRRASVYVFRRMMDILTRETTRPPSLRHRPEAPHGRAHPAASTGRAGTSKPRR